MPESDIRIDTAFASGDRCTTCREPVLDITRAVIYRRLLYHLPCWLQMTFAVASAEAVIATSRS